MCIGERMNYQNWKKTVPNTITNGSPWKMKAYRIALFVGDIGWRDVSKLMLDKRTISVADQLYRALGSISANLAEGYSRGTGRDRARFYEYALGSVRESKDWYYKARHILGDTVVEHRLSLLADTNWLLLTMIPQQRGKILRENNTNYRTESENISLLLNEELLADIPFTDWTLRFTLYVLSVLSIEIPA